MRIIALTTTVGLLTACSSEPEISFTLVSALQQETRGIALRDDAVANAGMSGQVCTLDVGTAEVIGDLDPSGGDEQLLDAWGERALASSGHSVFSLPRTRLDDGVRERWELSALDGRLIDDGAVVLSAWQGECAVTWTHQGAHLAAVVPETDCSAAPAFTVERDSGIAWLADGRNLARIAPDGSFARWDDVNADTLAWDPANAQLILGSRGDSWLQAVDTQGETLWTRSMSGGMVDVEVAGDSGVTAVMVSELDDLGNLELLDGLGDTVANHPLPGTAEVTFSDDAGAMALQSPSGTFFYVVDDDVSLFDVPKGVPGASANLAAIGVGLGVGLGVGAGVGAAILGTAMTVTLVAD